MAIRGLQALPEELPTVQEICEPRDDILTGAASLDMYAASLSQVVRDQGPDVYRDPATFFQNTYPTEGLKTTVKEVFTRLTGQGAGSPVIKLETSLGGGKTHTLIALYHLAKHGSQIAPDKISKDLSFDPVQVAAVVGTELGVARRDGKPSTLWGEIAHQLGKYDLIKADDQARQAPGKAKLRDLFGDDTTLILIDEIALYLANATAEPVGDTNLAKVTIAFLQQMSELASEQANVSLVITTLDRRTVFSEETGQVEKALGDEVEEDRAVAAVRDADEVVSRVVKNLTPTSRDEFPSVIRHRLFKDFNRTAGVEVCKAYHQALEREGTREYMPKHATEAKYLKYFQESYPFHPELMQILRTKTSSITQFNQTRGVLRLLGLLVQHVWNEGLEVPVIHAHHLDFRKEAFRDELISRLDKNEYQAAVTHDLASERSQPRATLVDEGFSHPLGTWAATTIFLHSLTGLVGTDVRRGCNEAEVQLATYLPGMDPKATEQALKGLEEHCFFLVKQGSAYAFNTEPNLNKIVEDAKDTVEATHVLKEVRGRIQQIYGGKRFFQPCLFANEPSDVPDDTGKPKLAVLDYKEETTTGGSGKVPALVDKIYGEMGTQGKPRVFRNNVVFLVPDGDETERMEAKAREFLALKKLTDDLAEGAPGILDLSVDQRQRLQEKRQEAELYLKVAAILAHKHLFIPATQASLDGGKSNRPLRRLTVRMTDAEVEQRVRGNQSEEQYLVNFLKNNNAAQTADDEPWAPEFVLDQLWPKNADSLDGEGFKKLFYKNPAADLVFAEDLVLRAMKRGVEEGSWYGILGKQFYDTQNAATFTGAFSGELSFVLTDADAGEKAWEQFNCPTCENRRTDCVCDVQTCPTCGNALDACTCEDPLCSECGRPLAVCGGQHGPTVIPRIEEKTIKGIVGELAPLLTDHDVERVRSLELKAKNRDELAKLALALPQFQGAEVRFDLEAVLSRRHVQDEEGRPGNHLKVNYEGDRQGFNDVKSVLLNYEGQESFNDCSLILRFTWPDGIDRNTLISLLDDKVAEFTEEAIYTAQQVQPFEEAAESEAAAEEADA